jgi:hypothetical protein
MATPELPESDGDAEPAASDGVGDPCTRAFRAVRHAVADGDDEAGAEALRQFMQFCDDDQEPEGEGPAEKPNLAMILMKKKGK